MADKLPLPLLQRIGQVKNRRARLVLDSIAKNGKITTGELKAFGYDHPPRAARDVRELGFSLITTMEKNAAGKRMAAYTLAPDFETGKAGRLRLSKKGRDAILEVAWGRCQLCGATHDLQVDHRVPYPVAGESLKDQPDVYMVLCGTCNRRKSWICEHCPNVLKFKRVKTCASCYWANPEEHNHVAMQPVRRVDILFQNHDVKQFDEFRKQCTALGISVTQGFRKLLFALRK